MEGGKGAEATGKAGSIFGLGGPICGQTGLFRFFDHPGPIGGNLRQLEDRL
ncbi:hypothetical protein PLACP1_05780 [Planifilum fimeticola]